MIYERIRKDRLKYREDRSVLSLIMSEICTDGKPMSDEDAIKILVQMKKNCQKTIELVRDRATTDVMELSPDLANIQNLGNEEYFLRLIEDYLPAAAQQEDVENALTVLNLPKTMKSMGPLMAQLKREFAVVDGNLVKSILMG